MRVARPFEEYERDLTIDEIKEAIGHTQAAMLEYARLGRADQAQAAFNARDDLLLALAERLKKEEVA
jgi:hypothetical protein